MNNLIIFLLVSFTLLVSFFLLLNLIIISIKIKETPSKIIQAPNISVIVAMKNESDNLEKLINSLSNQNYSKDKYEVILIDDNSTDDSFAKANELTNGLENFRIFKAVKKEYVGKRGALQVGLQNANFDFIALTDADCIPEQNWLIQVANALIQYDIALGAAPLMPGKNIASRFASYESGKAQILNFAGLKIGVPVSATGRNFAYKKTAFEKIGGYSNTLETLSGDDDLLLREAYKNKLKVGFINPDNALVFSQAPNNWKVYFRQRTRHVKASHHYTFLQQLLSFIFFGGDIVTTYSFLLIPINWLWIYIPALKLSIALKNYKQFKFFFGVNLSFREIIFFELIHPLIIILNFVGSIFRKENWN